MNEAAIIGGSSAPHTRASLRADLERLGLGAGDVVLLHCSLRAIGWACGGAVALLQAVLDALGTTGTLVMPSHSGDLSDPETWSNPPVPADWWPTIRAEMPAYDPGVTPTRGLGCVAELFRRWPGALRSAHPAMSFAAVGPQAHAIIDGHGIDFPLGERSPLARLYDLDARVLLVGVGHESNTSLHLAEYRAGTRAPCRRASPVLQDGLRVWRAYDDIDLDAAPFPAIGADFEATARVRRGPVGEAEGRLFAQRTAVDFATDWLARASH